MEIDVATSEEIARGLRKASEAAWDKLTPREQELCRRSTNGKTKREIADEMGISRDSVRKLQKNIRKKISWRANIYFGDKT